MSLSKLELALVALIADGLPASPDTDRRAELSAPACPPSNESAPYTASCLRFISGWFWRAGPAGDE